MIFISHRGNVSGPNPEKENHPDYLKNALDEGFHIEVDIWLIDGTFVLGHDVPQYELGSKLSLDSEQVWLHCKNSAALFCFANSKSYPFNFFTHEEDDFTLTSNDYIWTYPRNLPLDKNKSIAVMPERVPDWDWKKAYGICTDYPKNYKKAI